ncbi:MAG: METTL5 family protein [Candidatus Woesearchaeota archaeon]
MQERITKSGLAIVLSKLRDFEKPEAQSEQYTTDPEVAAEVLWQAYLKGDIEGKIIADLGSGTGLLGIGASILGAKKVYMIERDLQAIQVAKENIDSVGLENRFEILHQGIDSFNKEVEVVIQNPPFGTKVKHADREFLLKAFQIAPIVYSFHKSESTRFAEGLAAEHGFRITNRLDFEFPLKMTQKYHKRRILRIKVSAYRFSRTV